MKNLPNKSEINNSSKLLAKYIESIDGATVYKEANFPLKVRTDISLLGEKALSYLIGMSVAGSMTIGFFNDPKIILQYLLRNTCLIITTKLPKEIVVPTFFCNSPEDFSLIPHAMKQSMETGLPSLVILGRNSLNNFTTHSIPHESFPTMQPYINPDAALEKWDSSVCRDKLLKAYKALSEEIPQRGFTKESSFIFPKLSFINYIYPTHIDDQMDKLSEAKVISTTKQEMRLIKYIEARFGNIDVSSTIDIRGDIEYIEPPVKKYLCPGCPFESIFSNNKLTNKTVYTSIRCDAVLDCLPVTYLDYNIYSGLVKKKLNIQTIFVGNVSDLFPLNIKDHINDLLVVLKDNINISVPLKGNKRPDKIKTDKHVLFPYSCDNIGRFSKLKIKEKRCLGMSGKCDKGCIEKLNCPAILVNKSSVVIDDKLCTGCRSCIAYCSEGALS